MHRSIKWSATVVLAMAAPAMAGEVTGTGAYTPIHSYRAASICSFSGQNDDGAGPSSQVQAFGAFVAAFGRASMPHDETPGVACRG